MIGASPDGYVVAIIEKEKVVGTFLNKGCIPKSKGIDLPNFDKELSEKMTLILKKKSEIKEKQGTLDCTINSVNLCKMKS